MQEQTPTESNTTTSDRPPRHQARRGRSKLRVCKQFITELDLVGEPVVPFGVMGPYKKAIRVLVKDNIPIKYRYWKQPGSEWVVQSSWKNLY